MTEIDAVVNALGKCRRYDCDGCMEEHASRCSWDCIAYDELVDRLLGLLKKQEAVKPVKQIEQNEWTVCGNCKKHIISKWMFCPYCGRPVKWE